MTLGPRILIPMQKQSQSWLWKGVLALALGAVLGSPACGGVVTGRGSEPSPPSQSGAAGADPRLWIKENGVQQPFENGRAVTIDGTKVEIYVSPYPPGRTATIDFYLTRNGQPVENANLSLQYDMTVMEHGPFKLLAVPTGRGHFLAPLEFAMTGDFWLNVSLNLPGQESVINMFVRSER
jgi:hypothetical protein